MSRDCFVFYALFPEEYVQFSRPSKSALFSLFIHPVTFFLLLIRKEIIKDANKESLIIYKRKMLSFVHFGFGCFFFGATKEDKPNDNHKKNKQYKHQVDPPSSHISYSKL